MTVEDHSPSRTRPRTSVPPLDFDGGRGTWLEDLDRVGVHQLGAGIPKPPDDRTVRVEVHLRLGGHEVTGTVELRAHAVGLGRRWSAVCPLCGQGAAHLYVVDARLVCRRCTGRYYESQAMTHRQIFRDVLRPLRRAAALEHRAARRRIRRTTRERLRAQAQIAVERALAGTGRLGMPVEIVDQLRELIVASVLLPPAGCAPLRSA